MKVCRSNFYILISGICIYVLICILSIGGAFWYTAGIPTFRDQTIFGVGFPAARHSNLMEAPFDTSTLVDGAT